MELPLALVMDNMANRYAQLLKEVAIKEAQIQALQQQVADLEAIRDESAE